MELICATTNRDKLAEFLAMLDGVADLLARPESVGEIPEDAGTFVGNARLKAHGISQAIGKPALGDDSGLEVAALGGAPGVNSVDYGGPQRSYRDNCARVLAEMNGKTDRRARFRTVLVVAWPDGDEIVAEGVCEGLITDREIGERGFGYDAIFVPDIAPGILRNSTPQRTFAEMSMGEKNLVSHRSRALENLLQMLREMM